MIFNSIPFLIFFLVVFALYYLPFSKQKLWQNIILFAASYFFYGYANWKMLSLLLAATVIFYFIGIQIPKQTEKNQDRLKLLGVVLGLGLLLYFKYFGFFIDSFAALFNAIGLNCNVHSFKIILPLGISFFTFRLISYVLEVYDENIEPETDFISFANYISFFPCILSGPIDRPNTFLPYMQKARVFDYSMAVEGCRRILWGMFLKIVVADNCATYVDSVWSDLGAYTASTLVLSAVLYVIQLYADFAGYSSMAIGVSLLLGIKVMENFNYPLFALNIADLWRRWHISLTKWMTDYVYKPLSFMMRDWKKWGMILAIIINFVLVGFWHGANWIYGLYGLYHGLLFVPLILTGAFMQKHEIRLTRFGLPVMGDFGRMVLTFGLFAIGGIIFRAESVSSIGNYMVRLCDSSIITMPALLTGLKKTLLFAVIMLIIDWRNRKKSYPFDISNLPIYLRVAVYYALIIVILEYGASSQSFIYFQF